MSKKLKKGENYLERIPVRKEDLEWTKDEKDLVTLNIRNKGFFNFLAQKLFKKPKVSYIHLEENVSFRMRMIDCVGYIVDGALGGKSLGPPGLFKVEIFCLHEVCAVAVH